MKKSSGVRNGEVPDNSFRGVMQYIRDERKRNAGKPNPFRKFSLHSTKSPSFAKAMEGRQP